jgi:hypothetical protein
MGGPSICPACDCGDFGMARIKRQGKIIMELRERLARYERNDATGVFCFDDRRGD